MKHRRPIEYLAPGKSYRHEVSASDVITSDSEYSDVVSEIASRLSGKGLPGVLGRRQQKAIAERVVLEKLSGSDIEDLYSN